MVQTVAKTLDVDPNRGVDQPSGRPHLPYKTLTAALVAAEGNALIRLAPGTYSATTGEQFPVVVGDGVIVMGQEANLGEGIVLTGGGTLPGISSPTAALVVTGTGQVRGITVQNPQGIGLWVRSGAPLVRACRVTQCGQAGIYITGTARPLVINVRLEAIAGQGLHLTDQAKGEIRNCTIQRCNLGIHVTDGAAPLVRDNQCSTNQTGMRVAGAASPVLRQNRLVQNQQWGLLVQEQARPDLGLPSDEAGNTLRYNGQGDLRNDTGQTLITVGNDLLPQRLVGPISLTPSQLPDPAAVPPTLLDQPVTAPPAPVPPAVGPASPTVPLTSRFTDLQGHWATPYIEALADRNLVKGFEDGTYRPNTTINRAQFAALVTASYGALPFVRAAVSFLDVPPSFWAARAIDLAQRRGFVSGYPDQTYRPNQPMTRVQAMVAVASGLGLPPAPASGLGVYGDRAQIPSYAIDALAAATQAGLIINHPDPGQLRPQEPMTRAEVAVLIYQGLVALGQAPALATVAVSRPTTVQGSFPDIQTHWARDFIQGLLNANLIRGQADGQFYPDQPMSRAQFAALISGAFNPAPRRPNQPFWDVPASYWAAKAIQTAYRAGFLAGFPDGSFAPEHPVLRVQTWVALVNGLGLLADQKVNPEVLNRFRDRATLPAFALDAVAQATQLGLVVNVPDVALLSPHRVASRADVAAVVYQTLVLQKRMPRLDSPYLVQV
ncbi:MAG TPA: S-layer homology domain-containing protein [Leptolyngbyaceae cyanobacterium M65_K2018_010]|nr:S-layer homology domain-containing protein [Leptolyngbyaceae cyanobacterium M65_K2018_010]